MTGLQFLEYYNAIQKMYDKKKTELEFAINAVKDHLLIKRLESDLLEIEVEIEELQKATVTR